MADSQAAFEAYCKNQGWHIGPFDHQTKLRFWLDACAYQHAQTKARAVEIAKDHECDVVCQVGDVEGVNNCHKVIALCLAEMEP